MIVSAKTKQIKIRFQILISFAYRWILFIFVNNSRNIRKNFPQLFSTRSIKIAILRLYYCIDVIRFNARGTQLANAGGYQISIYSIINISNHREWISRNLLNEKLIRHKVATSQYPYKFAIRDSIEYTVHCTVYSTVNVEQHFTVLDGFLLQYYTVLYQRTQWTCTVKWYSTVSVESQVDHNKMTSSLTTGILLLVKIWQMKDSDGRT